MKKLIDEKLFPAVIKYAVNRWHIFALLILGVVLMLFQKPIVELVGGNYTNVTSAVVALLILREEILQKKSHGDLHDKIDELHKKINPNGGPDANTTDIQSDPGDSTKSFVERQPTTDQISHNEGGL